MAQPAAAAPVSTHVLLSESSGLFWSQLTRTYMTEEPVQLERDGASETARARAFFTTEFSSYPASTMRPRILVFVAIAVLVLVVARCSAAGGQVAAGCAGLLHPDVAACDSVCHGSACGPLARDVVRVLARVVRAVC